MTLELATIKQDLENWVANYLDVPSMFYNGSKPCPFAKKAWVNNKVNVVLGTKPEVVAAVDEWDDKFDLTIVVYDHTEWQSNEWVKKHNPTIIDDDLYLMSFDPDEFGPDDPNLDPHNWGSVTDEVYGMVFVQRLSKLINYSDNLVSSGYYQNVSEDFMAYVNGRNSICAEKAKQRASVE